MKKELTVGIWKACRNGDLYSPEHGYHIDHSRLLKENWFVHLQQKNWFTWNDFMPCYMQACINAGIKRFTMVTNYSFYNCR